MGGGAIGSRLGKVSEALFVNRGLWSEGNRE